MTAGDSTSSSQPARVVGRPFLPDNNANPTGKNQYTYRHKFEHAITRLLEGEVREEYLKLIPECARPLLQDIPDDWELGDVLAAVITAQAMTGDDKAMAEVLKRIWPATQKHEIEDDRTVVVVRDYSGGRNGRSPHEIGPVTIEANAAGTYSAVASGDSEEA